MSNNLELWNKVSKTDPNHTKKVNKGALKLTAINATYQSMNATSEWGKYGEMWGLENIELDYINGLCNNQILCVGKANFFYPEGNFQIGSSILVQSWVASKSYNKVDDDFLKKLETDMLTKSLSKLGFNADVFLGLYDDNKYVQSLQGEFKSEDQKKEETRIEARKKEISKQIEDCKTKEEVKKVYSKIPKNLQSQFLDQATKKGENLK